jgi:hypothetical protein
MPRLALPTSLLLALTLAAGCAGPASDPPGSGGGAGGGGTGVGGGSSGAGGGGTQQARPAGRDTPAAFDALSASERAALANLKVLFHHHSVGENIMGQWNDTTAANGSPPPRGASSLGFPFRHAATPADYGPGTVRLGENTGGANGDAASKLASFADLLDARGFGAAVQVAVFKFCYLDVGGGSTLTSLAQVQALEATYRATMAALAAKYPALRIVHVTPPLKSYWNSDSNDLRLELGRFLEAEYGASGHVFDLQDLESHDATGALCAHSGTPVICEPYVGGTGHLTDLGSDLAARGLLYTLYRAGTGP